MSAFAAVGVVALPTGSADWTPVTYGLTAEPEHIVPDVVTEAQPARVVSTTIDEAGRPVVTVKEATDRASAVKLVKDAQKTDNAVGVEMDAPVHALGIPTGSDPYRAQQWDFTKIRTAEAWQRSTGSGATVAVIDSGVDAAHPDLAANVLPGYDAIANTAGTSTDGNGHGTHVAGTIAAVTGNGVGVSGIAPDVRILPVKVLGANGSGNMSDTAEGIVWAADNGAQVINMSLGSTTKVSAVSNAITYARNKGVTVIAAAGNSRQEGSPISYPAADDGVVAVAATDSADKVASYSNAGSYVDVAAPGSGIMSTYPTALGKQYTSMNGTSMAAPHVAAVAALLKGYQGSLTPDQIETALEKSAADLGPAGFDNDFGNGRIDAAAALATITPPATAPTTAPTIAPTKAPTTAPTTSAPTTAPTTAPTKAPTTAPTTPPTKAPTTAPTSAPTVAPSPSRTVAKVKPVITADVAGGEVVHGTAVTTTFTVKADNKAWSGKPVQICVTEGAAAQQCADATTGSAGTVRVNRTAKASYQLVLKAVATTTSEAATSAPVTYKVRAAVTVARTAKGKLAVTLTGAVGRPAEIQQNIRGAWTTVGKYTASASPVKVTITGLVAGQTYRVMVPAGPTVLGVTSAPIVA
ncbi:S8 family peptidase [Actinoplanes hulinensis]|uniref:S8 family peptidase n=2 Tax=Actinoplanes hulinensis TaxID=1144547 RepID=A0ABS7BES5_9ACTN|nr:S8 family peptidase [Actinoplanes hulinensis]